MRLGNRKMALVKATTFFVLVGLAVGQFIIVCFTAVVRFSNSTGTLAHVPPELPIQTYIGINRLIALCCVCVGAGMGQLWRRSGKQVKALWFFFAVLALVLLGLAQGQLARDIWMQAG